MTSEDIITVIADETGLPREKLKPDVTLGGLDISSLDLVSVLFSLEDRFGVVIEPESIKPDFTLQQFVDLVGALHASA